MATDTSSMGGNTIPCPDPSVHEHKNKLSEAASTAALYATNPDRNTDSRATERESPLGPDGKLSSRGAATSLRYARAQDLPSFPSSGNAADSAGKAAMLAKDYKMKDLWQPEMSSAGSKAALLAHGKGSKLDLWQPSASADGNSAATLAMRNKGLSPKVDYGYTPDGKSRALQAATMSVNKGRQRAESSPAPIHPAYPDSRNAGHNALNAATASHRAASSNANKAAPDGWDSEANQAARITHLGGRMDRAMFTEHPPVEPEREEARHNAALRASAVSMAKQMYDLQNRTASPTADGGAAGAGAGAAHARSPSTTQQADLKQEAMRYIHLQEAAHKLAAERLAKVDKNNEAARYREYYGYGGDDKSKRISSRFSMLSGRKRSSSEADADLEDSDDEAQARRIRSQMSQLNSGLSSVDNKKQQDDRARLMAAAEKRVSRRMHDMDEKVFLDTGKVPPAMMEEWEEKARKRAQEEKLEKAQNSNKTHIGGGKYMETSEIEAIAAARLKPTLDEINDTAEKKRARDEELRLEREEQERSRREEKARNREEKEEQKRAKNEEKATSRKEKEEAKARKSEDKRVAKEDKRKSREAKREEVAEVAAVGAAGAALAEVAEKVKEDKEKSRESAAAAGSTLGEVAEKVKEDKQKSHETAVAAGTTLSEVADKAKEDQKTREAPRDGVKDPVAAGAAGATLGEVASKVKHDNEAAAPSPAAAAGVDRRRSTLGRLKDRFKKSNKTDSEVEEEAEEKPRTSTATSTGAGLAGGAVAGAAVGATLADTEDAPGAMDPQQAAHALGEDDPSAAVVPTVVEPDAGEETETEEAPEVGAVPRRPLFQQVGSFFGMHSDAVASDPVKPDLERHISRIPDDSSSEDSEWDDGEVEDSKPEASEERGRDIAERVAAAPVVAAPVVAAADGAERTPRPVEEPTVSKAVEPAVSNVQAPVEQRPPQTQTLDEPTDRSAAPAALATGTVAGGAVLEDERHHNKLHKDPPEKNQKELKAEKPRELHAGKTTTPGFTTPATEYIRKTSVEAERPSFGAEDGEKERKGFRGFISKLRSKPSRPENRYPDFKPASETKPTTQESSAKPTTSSSTTDKATAAAGGAAVAGDHVGTDGPIGDPYHVSGLGGNPKPESISSFTRGDATTTAPRELDDVSSSGADEDDVHRGRTGRLARKLGLVKDSSSSSHGKTTAAAASNKDAFLSTPDPATGDAAVDRQQSLSHASHTEDEQFEEARDHFDESAAPRPAFAAPEKNASPVRGTRFQEEL